ncbi:hypothetical protein BOX15_Mlig028014g1 [Macrostomum lignano]|uniref:Delta-like protein n=1 Tax=Macrostomum lignano TaxID=282301 RepID=A0A267ESU5_9PLAT|nr:hypothetical protein BOX15_Mlig028014g1 [Macrostomum lignano]
MICQLFLLLIGVSVVNSNGYMTLRFLSYINHDSRCQDGTYCDPFGLTYVGDKCDPQLRLIADRSVPGGNGLFDYQQLGVYWDTETINFGSRFGEISNPVIIAMNFQNHGHIYVTVLAVDKDPTPPDDPMDTFSAALVARADKVKRRVEMLSQPTNHKLSIEYWYSCHANYYGLDCNTFCQPQNDNVRGHYSCSSEGAKMCFTGWTGVDCTQPDPCNPSPCLNGATCSNVGGVASCTCPSGFTGSRCETDIDECKAVDSPCLNNATCENTIGSFRCKCSLGFTGERCETDVNECESETSVCLNHGTCKNTFGGFNCSCPPGLTGHRCELDVDECANGTSACANGGTCVNVFGNYTCQCDSGFTGPLCEEDIDECTESPCVNGGTCENRFGSFECICPSGFAGRVCDKDEDECLRSPCSNGGSCVNTIGNFSCLCSAGFTGSLCDEDIDECLMAPCFNESTCVNSIGNFTCQCPPGFEGRLCDKDVDECSKFPPKCRNGGNCTNTLGSFRCTCPTGLIGGHCEQDIDECKLAAPPCRNNGSCQNSFGGFSCRCGPAFRGRHCEIRAEASVGSTTGESSKLLVYILIGVGVLLIGAASVAVGIAFYRIRRSGRSNISGAENNKTVSDCAAVEQGLSNPAYMSTSEIGLQEN